MPFNDLKMFATHAETASIIQDIDSRLQFFYLRTKQSEAFYSRQIEELTNEINTEEDSPELEQKKQALSVCYKLLDDAVTRAECIQLLMDPPIELTGKKTLEI